MIKCRFCNECKNQRLLWDLYVGITMNVKNQQLLWDLYVGITYLKMKKTSDYYGTHMRVL
jgi:hypothetical protein